LVPGTLVNNELLQDKTAPHGSRIVGPAGCWFLAAAPPEQVGAHDGKESTDSIWVSPREALEGGETGRFKLPFPTTRNLIKLGKQGSVKAALDDSRGKSVITVTPIMTKNNGGRQLRIPLEAGYDGELFEVGSVG
jgi:hypothetical protein